MHIDFGGSRNSVSNLKNVEKVTEGDVEKLMEMATKTINTNNKGDMSSRESAIFNLAYIFSARNEKENLLKLIPILKNHIVSLSKPRASKLVQDLLNLMLETDMDKQPAIELCNECVEWAEHSKSNFLAHSLRVRLAELFYEEGDYEKCAPLVSRAVNDMKIYDNRKQMVEILLLESRLYYAMGNTVKAKASLTSARITAASTYVPQKLQADMDMQSATIHAKDRDFSSAYSYFYEAFDLYRGADHPKTSKALKYVLLCKIMLNKPDDVSQFMIHKTAAPFVDENLRTVEQIAQAFKRGSLTELNEIIEEHGKYLYSDIIIRDHLVDLIENLIEKSILTFIKPYSSIGLDYMAQKLKIDKTRLVIKLSSMILDRKFEGILDQGCEILEIRQKVKEDPILEDSIKLVSSLGEIVEALRVKINLLPPV